MERNAGVAYASHSLSMEIVYSSSLKCTLCGQQHESKEVIEGVACPIRTKASF